MAIKLLPEIVERKGMADTILYFENWRDQYIAQGRAEYYNGSVIERMVGSYRAYDASVKTDLDAVVEYFEKKYVRTTGLT